MLSQNKLVFAGLSPLRWAEVPQKNQLRLRPPRRAAFLAVACLASAAEGHVDSRTTSSGSTTICCA